MVEQNEVVRLVRETPNMAKVARLVGLSRERVRQIAKKHGIDIKDVRRKKPFRSLKVYRSKCPWCGKIVERIKNPRTFCNRKCHSSFVKKVFQYNLFNRFGSFKYRQVAVKVDGKWTTKIKAREIMTKVLGRKLNYNEVIHHIDGDITNNDLSNLRLMSRSDHSKFNCRRAWSHKNEGVRM